MHRPAASKIQTLAAAAAGVALIVASFFVFAPGKGKGGKGEPNIDALKAVLEKSATEVLPPPTVATAEIVLATPSAEREAEIDRIVAIAADLGGTALRSPSADGELEVLAQIPQAKAADFRARVTGKDAPASPTPAADGEATELIVVKFRETAPKASAESPAP